MAAESGVAGAVRPINNLVTAQVRKVFPSLIDVKGVERPKEFTGTWGGIPTMVEEDGGILCWCDRGM